MTTFAVRPVPDPHLALVRAVRARTPTDVRTASG